MSSTITKKVLVSILGQSNEAGAIGGVITTNGVLGAPQVATTNSMWPRLAGLVAKRGIWAEFYNAAIGATNLTDVWVGRCRSYTVSMIVSNGSYVLDGGNIYKAVGALGAVNVLNVAPSAGVGTSGLTSWTNLGTATGEDTPNKIYALGSARYDPNGLLAGIISNISSRVGFDEKWLFVSIGQGDKTLSSSAAEYGQAMISVANHFTSLGYRVFLGFTCYGATAGLDAWYTSDLLVGRLNALASLASNSKVHAGANLRADLGVLPVAPTVTATGQGLLSDSLHLNKISAMDAADSWDRQLESIGY